MRAAFAAFLLLSLTTAAASAEPSIVSDRYDDWFYRCVEAEGSGPARCEAVQIAQTKQGEETINLLTISLSEAVQDKTKNTVLTVLAPLNVFLPSGLDLTVGNGKPVTLQYRNCNNAGCWIQHVADAKTLDALKSSDTGTAKVRLINGQNLNIKFSLKGLKEALKAMQDRKQPTGKS